MLAKITIILTVAAYGLAIGGIVLTQSGLIASIPGAALFGLSGLVGIIAFGCATAILFTTQHFPAAMMGMTGALPFLLVVTAAVDGFRYPPINDISTDTQNPPQFVRAPELEANQGRDMAFPVENAAIIAEAYPDCVSLELDLAPATAYARARAVADKMPRWEITREDPDQGVFEAVAATRVFLWKDDLVVRVTEAAEGRSRVDMRSKSREGKSDLGANARRIRHFFALMTE